MAVDDGRGYAELVAGAFHVPNGSGDEPYLIGSRCGACGVTVFPRMTLCPACHREMQPRHIGKRGRLYSFTVAHVAPEGLRAPYYQAFVELPEGPRVFALISDEVPIEPGALADGMEMELVIEPVRVDAQNRPVLTYKYRPARGQGAAR